jgi:hypothetical protein
VEYTLTLESPEPVDDGDPVRTVVSGTVHPRNLAL